MEWTVTGYLIGFSLGQFLWGPLGDRNGRCLPVAIGLVLFVEVIRAICRPDEL